MLLWTVPEKWILLPGRLIFPCGISIRCATFFFLWIKCVFCVLHRILCVARWMKFVVYEVRYICIRPQAKRNSASGFSSGLPFPRPAASAVFFCISRRNNCRQEPCMPWNYKSSTSPINQRLWMFIQYPIAGSVAPSASVTSVAQDILRGKAL